MADTDMAIFVYVSNAADGDISMFRMGPDGALTSLGRAAAGANVMPLAVAPDKRHLHAAIRSDPNRVATYRIDATTGRLSLAGTSPLAQSMCYLSTDRTGRWLFAASYGADLLSVNRIGADGLPHGEPVQLVHTGRNAHSIVADPSNRYVYACNLGVDRVLQFALDADTGTLTPIGEGFVAAPARSGPRHMAFSPDGQSVHVIGELSGTVTTYRIDARTGALSMVDDALAVPASFGLAQGIARGPGVVLGDTPRVWASDIHARPDGRFVYIAERTSSTICALAVDPSSGALSYSGHFGVEQQPRGFAIDPRGRFMVVAGELSPELGVYALDSASGALELVMRTPSGQGANWVEIVELD